MGTFSGSDEEDDDASFPSDSPQSQSGSQSPAAGASSASTKRIPGFFTPIGEHSSRPWKSKSQSPLTSPPFNAKDVATSPVESEGDYFSQLGSTGRNFDSSTPDTPKLVVTGPDDHKVNLSKTTVTNTLRNKGHVDFDDHDIDQQHRKSYGPDTDADGHDDEQTNSQSDSDNSSNQMLSGVGDFYSHASVNSPGSISHLIQPNLAATGFASQVGNIMDVGLRTSGGLAPGAVNYEQEQQEQARREAARNSAENPSLLDRRRGSLRSLHFDHFMAPQQSGANDSAPHSANTSGTNTSGTNTPHFGEDSHAIPLRDLDRKLSTLRSELDPEAQENAKLLVQGHLFHGDDMKKRKNQDDGMYPEYDAERGYVVPNMEYLRNVTSNSEQRNSSEDSNGKERNEGSEYYANDMPDGTRTPVREDYVAPPKQVRQGILGSLLKLYADDAESTKSGNSTLVGGASTNGTPTSAPTTPTGSGGHSGSGSGATTPGGSNIFRPTLYRNLHSDDGRSSRPKWYKHKSTNSTSALGTLVSGASQTIAAPAAKYSSNKPKSTKDVHFNHFPGNPNSSSLAAKKAAAAAAKKRKAERLAEQLRITVHIADVLQRQRFILRICKALMLFGAPTHRLEEYMKMTSRVLEIDGQFLYMPGCMIVSFGDATTHTSEMQLVRCVQGLNLSKLHETHLIYKEVVHDVISVEEASTRLEELLAMKNTYPKWVCVFLFGLASAMATMFAFKGGWPDLPVSCVLAGCVGFLQVYVAPKSDLYSNVFEVTSSIIVSFLGRAFGSIGHSQSIFCFAALAQGSLALILPGYIILCGALELQSRNMVAGSVRMFYAVIYSLFLGFGITLGAAIYGWIDGGAVSTITCHRTVDDRFKILFIPAYSILVAMVNQASLRQLPVMGIIGSAGYAVTYFIGKRVPNSSEFTSAIGAFAIGIMGNIYSRVGHGLAFAAMLPAIFIQVPSGIASQGSLVTGLENANALVHNTTTSDTSTSSTSGLDLGFGMIQVSVGITVGLFVATLLVYPLGKKRSGLFTF